LKSIIKRAAGRKGKMKKTTSTKITGKTSSIIDAEEMELKKFARQAADEQKKAPAAAAKAKKGAMTDKELQDTLDKSSARIKVIGAGGSGNNTMLRMSEIGIHGAEFIAVNTDAQHLLMIPADKKVLIGKKLTRGLGAGSNPQVGEEAAKENQDDIREVLDDANLVFITCGLGGGTGTGCAPVIGNVAKDMGALTVAIVTLPFSVEGKKRMQNALSGLQKLRKHTDTTIVIPNDKLLEIVPELPLNAAFKVADEVLTNAVKGITEMITRPGLVNLDFADVRTILTDGGSAMIGLGESSGDTTSSEARALEAVEEALNSPLLDVDVSDSNRALINVIGGGDMSLREAEIICEAVASKIHHESHIIWGAMVNEDLPRNTIQAMVLISGGRIPYLEEGSSRGTDADLDLDYV